METSNKKISYLVLFIVLVIIGAALLAMEGVDFVSLFVDYGTIATGSDLVAEETQFGKNLDVWFMLMLVAFLMIFIKKYEWGVALAVLLSAAASFVVYLGIMDFYFEAPWNQVLLIKAVVCAITLVIAIATYEKLFDKMMSNVREVKARGAVVLGITVRGKEEALKQETDYQFCVPDITDFMLPSLSILPLQLFAYYVASMKGCDIDKPRNLAKSVTVE